MDGLVTLPYKIKRKSSSKRKWNLIFFFFFSMFAAYTYIFIYFFFFSQSLSLTLKLCIFLLDCNSMTMQTYLFFSLMLYKINKIQISLTQRQKIEKKKNRKEWMKGSELVGESKQWKWNWKVNRKNGTTITGIKKKKFVRSFFKSFIYIFFKEK